jgi:hypothetical protein
LKFSRSAREINHDEVIVWIAYRKTKPDATAVTNPAPEKESAANASHITGEAANSPHAFFQMTRNEHTTDHFPISPGLSVKGGDNNFRQSRIFMFSFVDARAFHG